MVMGQTTSKPQPQWLEKRAKENGLSLLTDVHITGKELGRGRTSVVEEVDYNGEVCAVKILATSYRKNRFLEEAKQLATLEHPHILRIIGVAEVGLDKRVALVLEKCATTLRQFLSSYQKEMVPLQLKLQILQQVSEAVQYLHTQEPPIVHSDISSTNIYLTDEYQVKLGDFGSAKRGLGLNTSGGSQLMYASAFSNWSIKTSSDDIFAVGVLIIEVIIHQQPFPTEYINLKTSVPYTEYQRRQKYIDTFSTEEEHFVPIIKECLTASDADRLQASGLITRIRQIRSASGVPNNLLTAKNLNLSSHSSLTSAMPQNIRHSFRDLHQFRLPDVHETGVELGGGTFSVVYEVEWDQRMCAAKHFRVFGHKPGAINQIAESLVHECRHWLKLKHPHIVETLGWYEKDEGSFPIIVMEKLDTSLKDHLKSCNCGQFPLMDKAAILLQVATAIEYLHTRSPPLIHGDITANNVMLKGSPPCFTAKLADFGLTRVFDMMSITPQSVGRGTYAYISPEFFAQPPAITEKTDNFCFGILLIHTITHNYPIPTASAMYKGGDQPLKALTELERRQEHICLFTLQERHCLEDIIRHCLEEDPEQRPTSTVILQQMFVAKEKLVKTPVGPSALTLPSSRKRLIGKNHSLLTAPKEDASVRLQLAQAIKQLSSEYAPRFTADSCASIIRAEAVLSDYAVADIEATEDHIKRTEKLFYHLQQVEVENVKRFCLAIINNRAFPRGTPEHEWADSLLRLPPMNKTQRQRSNSM